MTALSVVNPARLQDWDEILSRTREMLEAANDGDWDRVVELEAVRREQISRFFAPGVADYEAARVRRGIEEILASDRELLAMSQRQKERRSADILQLRQRAVVEKAYGAAG